MLKKDGLTAVRDLFEAFQDESSSKISKRYGTRLRRTLENAFGCLLIRISPGCTRPLETLTGDLEPFTSSLLHKGQYEICLGTCEFPPELPRVTVAFDLAGSVASPYAFYGDWKYHI